MFKKTIYRNCVECGNEFEIEIPEQGAWLADGHEPNDYGVGWATWNITHQNNSGGECEAILSLEEDGTF